MRVRWQGKHPLIPPGGHGLGYGVICVRTHSDCDAHANQCSLPVICESAEETRAVSVDGSEFMCSGLHRQWQKRTNMACGGQCRKGFEPDILCVLVEV